MKLAITSFPLLAIAATALSAANVTIPVGFIMLTVPGDGQLAVAQPFYQNPVFISSIDAVVETDAVQGFGEITVNGGTFEDDSDPFDGIASTETVLYYARICSGDREGIWYHVRGIKDGTTNVLEVDTANDPEFVQVDEDDGLGTVDQAVADPATKIKIIPYYTLDGLFPDGGDLTASTDFSMPEGDLVLFVGIEEDGLIGESVSDSNVTIAARYFYWSGAYPGWYAYDPDQSGVNQTPVPSQEGEDDGDVGIAPDNYFIISNSSSESKEVSILGTVPAESISTIINRGAAGTTIDNHFVNAFPVDISLAETNLQNSSIFRQSTSLLSPEGDKVIVYPSSGGQLGSLGKPTTYIFYAGGEADPRLAGLAGQTGWYDINNIFAGPRDNVDDKDIKAGQGIIVRTKGVGTGASDVVNADIPYQL